jgi:hypothetical protein
MRDTDTLVTIVTTVTIKMLPAHNWIRRTHQKK